MGYDAFSILNLKMLWDRKALFPGARILEFGAQEGTGDAEAIRAALWEVAEHLGRTVTIPPLACPVDMGAMFTLLGFTHKAIDVNDLNHSEFFDLNTQAVPDAELGTYDWINNEGTTEHICNQMNALCVAHDFCKVGGYMSHSVPLMGWVDHGLMNATPKFWSILAGENAYRTVSAVITLRSEPHPMPEWYSAWTCDTPFTFQDVWLNLLFRKTQDRPFVVPMDHLELDTDGSVAQRLIANSRRMLDGMRS